MATYAEFTSHIYRAEGMRYAIKFLFFAVIGELLALAGLVLLFSGSIGLSITIDGRGFSFGLWSIVTGFIFVLCGILQHLWSRRTWDYEDIECQIACRKYKH